MKLGTAFGKFFFIIVHGVKAHQNANKVARRNEEKMLMRIYFYWKHHLSELLHTRLIKKKNIPETYVTLVQAASLTNRFDSSSVKW